MRPNNDYETKTVLQRVTDEVGLKWSCPGACQWFWVSWHARTDSASMWCAV